MSIHNGIDFLNRAKILFLNDNGDYSFDKLIYIRYLIMYISYNAIYFLKTVNINYNAKIISYQGFYFNSDRERNSISKFSLDNSLIYTLHKFGQYLKYY